MPKKKKGKKGAKKGGKKKKKELTEEEQAAAEEAEAAARESAVAAAEDPNAGMVLAKGPAIDPKLGMMALMARQHSDEVGGKDSGIFQPRLGEVCGLADVQSRLDAFQLRLEELT